MQDTLPNETETANMTIYDATKENGHKFGDA